MSALPHYNTTLTETTVGLTVTGATPELYYFLHRIANSLFNELAGIPLDRARTEFRSRMDDCMRRLVELNILKTQWRSWSRIYYLDFDAMERAGIFQINITN